MKKDKPKVTFVPNGPSLFSKTRGAATFAIFSFLLMPFRKEKSKRETEDKKEEKVGDIYHQQPLEKQDDVK